MDCGALWREIRDDPAKLGYAGKTDAQIVALLNTKTQTTQRPVPIGEVLKWAATGERLAAISDAIGKGPPAKRANPMVAFELMKNPNVAALDLSDAGLLNIFQTMVNDAVLPANALDMLLALSCIKVSRAEVLGLPFVGPHHVAVTRG